MKYFTTDREQRENNYIIVKFGYCQIQNIERCLSANAYTKGIYGWKADFYNFGNRTISTGYQPIKKCNDQKSIALYNKMTAQLLKLEEKLKKGLIDWHKTEKVEKLVEKIMQQNIEQ